MDYNNRRKIGISFIYGSEWMGAVIYIINLIKSIDKLPDADKPELIVFYNDKAKPFIKGIQYSYLTLIYRKTPNQYFNYGLSFLTRRNYFEGGLIDKYNLDGLFPFNDFPVNLGKNNQKGIAWIPDLQHKYYPQYFSKVNLFFREWRFNLILKNADKIVLSSNSVHEDFTKFYKIKDNFNIHILRFPSLMEGIAFPSIETLRNKYNIKENYFIVSNQFYRHKDHASVFKAIKNLKEENLNFKVVFTGRMDDKRNPQFIDELQALLKKLEISDKTCFVGLLDRGEQLCLMKHSLAVIQPSLFEGWSTVVEDAKALGCQIIASNLKVHLEQLDEGNKGFIFKAQNEHNLADIMKAFIKEEVINKPVFKDYEKFTIDFANKFIKIFL